MDAETAVLLAETAASRERSARMAAATEALAALTRRIKVHQAVMPSEAGEALECWHTALVAIRAQGDQALAALHAAVAESERADVDGGARG